MRYHHTASVYYVLSCIWLFATPWTAGHHAPLSMGFSRQEHRSGSLFPSPIQLVERSKSKTLTANIDGDVEQQELSCWWECKMIIATLEDSLAVPYKTKPNSHIIKPSCSLAFTQMSWKFMSTQKTAHRLFTAALFITKTWKQTSCPLGGKWINYNIRTQWTITQH